MQCGSSVIPPLLLQENLKQLLVFVQLFLHGGRAGARRRDFTGGNDLYGGNGRKSEAAKATVQLEKSS